MITVECLPHDTIEFAVDEIGRLDDLLDLPWQRAGAATCAATRMGIELRIGPYVGQLVVPGRVVVNIREPFPGTVATCLDLSLTGRLADDQLSQQGTVIVNPWSTVADRFSRELAEYIAGGLERKYVRQSIVTARPRGRIDVRETVLKLHSRGRIHQLVCTISPITDETRLNRALVVAASRAEQLIARASNSSDLTLLRTSARALAGITAERAPDFRLIRRELGGQADRWGRLVGLAEILTTGVPALPKNVAQEYAQPMSAWLNVERIFEEAVLRVLNDLVGNDGSLSHGRGLDVPLLGQLPRDPQPIKKAADPDVVLRRDGSTWLLDAKYRRHANDFTEEELYQLMAHVDAYGAAGAALVSPARGRRAIGVHWLGRGRNGTSYCQVVVDPTSPRGIIGPLTEWLQREFMPQ